jgi:hypothetical protein
VENEVQQKTNPKSIIAAATWGLAVGVLLNHRRGAQRLPFGVVAGILSTQNYSKSQ